MADNEERVDWSALMDAHGIDPDADTASPAAEPVRRIEPEAGGRRSRLFHVVIAVTAVFSIAASVAVLLVLTRGEEEEEGGGTSAVVAEAVASNRPAAFQQTSDGVAVVPPETAPEPPAAAEPAESKAAARPESRPETNAAAKPVKQPETRPESKPETRAASKPETNAESKVEPAAAEPETAPENLPDAPDPGGIDAAMGKLQKEIEACAAKSSVTGEVGIKMRIEPDGSVAWASAKLQNSPFQSCLDRLFKKARMPKSAKGATVRQSVQLP